MGNLLFQLKSSYDKWGDRIKLVPNIQLRKSYKRSTMFFGILSWVIFFHLEILLLLTPNQRIYSLDAIPSVLIEFTLSAWIYTIIFRFKMELDYLWKILSIWSALKSLTVTSSCRKRKWDFFSASYRQNGECVLQFEISRKAFKSI